MEEAMNYLGLAAGLFGLDYVCKERIEAQDPAAFPRDAQKGGGKIRLYRNHNRGFCFGFLEKKPELVRQLPLVFTSTSAGALFWLLTRRGSRTGEKLGFAFLTAGALSNLCDRLRRGYVVDYLNFRIGILKKVVFNLGDLCILAGSLILGVTEFADFGREGSGPLRWPWQRRRSQE